MRVKYPKKYPRTMHLPYSYGRSSDDRVLNTVDHFAGREVVVTMKMDGENCVRGDVLIETTEGSIPIADIVDERRVVNVLSYNEATCEIEPQPVIDWSVTSEIDEWYEIETMDGQIVHLTGEHRVFLPLFGVYRKVCHLQDGDTVLLCDK